MEISHVRAFACAAAVACVLAAADAHACKSDVDCKGARICQAGKCTSPEPEAKPSPKKKTETKKAKKDPPPPPAPKPEPEPEPIPEPPAPVIEKPAPSPKLEPVATKKAPWAGAAEPVRGTINLLGGYGVRAEDNVYFGTGFGLQAGVVSRGGVYFGIRAHEYLTNTKRIPNAYGWAKAEGRSSFYAMELGFDAAASSRVVVRALLAVGVLRTQGRATGEVLGTPIDVRHDETDLCVEPSFAVWVRASPSWFVGPQVGLLMAFEDGPAIGAGNVGLGLGRVW